MLYSLWFLFYCAVFCIVFILFMCGRDAWMSSLFQRFNWSFPFLDLLVSVSRHNYCCLHPFCSFIPFHSTFYTFDVHPDILFFFTSALIETTTKFWNITAFFFFFFFNTNPESILLWSIVHFPLVLDFQFSKIMEESWSSGWKMTPKGLSFKTDNMVTNLSLNVFSKIRDIAM